MNEKLKQLIDGRVTLDPAPVFRLDKYGVNERRNWEGVPMDMENQILGWQSSPGLYEARIAFTDIKDVQILPERQGIQQGILKLRCQIIFTDHGIKFESLPVTENL